MALEFRTIAAVPKLDQTEASSLTLCGMAATYDGVADLGAYRERIAPGAFSKSLADGDDCRCLVNHDPNKILGRCKNGTLALRETDQGLAFAVSINPEVSYARDLYSAVKRGDMSECSFAFTCDDDDWDTETDDSGTPVLWRTLKRVNLYDVSIVTQPAYDNTSVMARAAAAGQVEMRSKRNFARYTPTGVLADLDATHRRLRDLWARRISIDYVTERAWSEMKTRLRCAGAMRPKEE